VEQFGAKAELEALHEVGETAWDKIEFDEIERAIIWCRKANERELLARFLAGRSDRLEPTSPRTGLNGSSLRATTRRGCAGSRRLKARLARGNWASGRMPWKPTVRQRGFPDYIAGPNV
jgi:hypothetical protein